MTQEIRHGLVVSTRSRVAAEAFQQGLDCLLASVGDAGACMRAAVDADPDFLLPRLALAPDPSREPQLADRVRPESLTAWEHDHAALWLERGRTPSHAWTQRALAHVGRHPADAWMFDKIQSHVFFFGGSALRRQLEELSTELAGRFGADPYYLSRHAFFVIEGGDPARGLEILEGVLPRWEHSVSARHCQIHALHGLGRHEQVAAICEQLGDLTGKFASHIAWHHALVLLGRGEIDRALDVFWRRFSCQPEPCVPPHLALADASGFAWAYLVATGVAPPRLEPLATVYDQTAALNPDDFNLLQRAVLGGALRAESELSDLPPDRYGDLGRSIARADWHQVDATVGALHAEGLEEVGGSRLQRAVVALAGLWSAGRPGRASIAAVRTANVPAAAMAHPVIAARLGAAAAPERERASC